MCWVVPGMKYAQLDLFCILFIYLTRVNFMGNTQWFGASFVCHACSFTFMQIYEMLFANGQSMDYENCRFYAYLRYVAWPCLKYGL